MENTNNVWSFYHQDFNRSLFPLNTNAELIHRGYTAIHDYIYDKIGPAESKGASFMLQERVNAAKPKLHLRRTHKLDAISEFFVYDLIYKHRAKFTRPSPKNRKNFGYRFKNGELTSPSDAHRAFKDEIIQASKEYRYHCHFDIACYFNSIYHHDLAHWFSSIALTDDYSNIFGKFFRQINSGRSVDCLTQGIAPTKVLGSHFLTPIDLNPSIRSPLMLRFMDDYYIFSDSWKSIGDDFLVIQQLLGEFALSINPAKTKFSSGAPDFVSEKTDRIRRQLLVRRRLLLRASGDDDTNEEPVELTEEEREYLLSLLHSNDIDEEDAELVLALVRDGGDELIKYIDKVLKSFPHLARNVAIFCDHIDDAGALAEMILEYLKNSEIITEYQLFWIAKIFEKKLIYAAGSDDIVTQLFEHKSATKITKAKLLEIPIDKYGLSERRFSYLRSGGSDWLSWSSAVGSKNEPKAKRNQQLKYFANSSSINELISGILQGP